MVDDVGSFGMSHMDHLDSAGIDMQIISPRPYQMMLGGGTRQLVLWFTEEETNNMIHRSCRELFPERFAGMAGLFAEPVDGAEGFGFLRCASRIEELGFVGVLLNPDPMEGQGPPLPPLGDRY